MTTMTRCLLAMCLALAACGEKSPAPPAAPANGATSPTTTAPPSSIASLLGPGGKHFAAERVYKGQCAPPGSRGGCITITLRPDGTYRHVHYDMVLDGTYTVSGTTVSLSGAVPGEGDEMTLAPDGRMLGELPLEP